MAIQLVSQIEGIEKQLSQLHMAAFPKGQGWKENEFKSLLEISFHHILIDIDLENQIRGFLMYSVIVDEAEILTFSVSPVWQKQKIGRDIMAVFIEKMKKKHVKRIFLEVAEENIPAIKLYDRFGFSLSGRRLKYYDNKVDALLMAKTL